jgi:hypothetical protein
MAERNPSDDQAAFGVFPQLKRNRSKQDREAAKNVPVDLARGALAGVMGAPGDIESLVRMLPYLDEKTVLPTSEDIEKRLPFKSDTPVGRAATGLGVLGGGFYTGPGAPLRAVGALPSAIKRAGQDFAMASAAGAPHVIKPTGGNWLDSGSVNRVVDPLQVRVRTPGINGHTEANMMADDSLNKWANRNLTNYIKKEMGTPEDSVRKLAEEGIVHIPTEQVGMNRYKANAHRATHGGEQLGKSEAARAWEDAADVAISPMEIKSLHRDYREPWMDKADPSTKIYEPTNEMHSHYLGFDHIMDVLREDVASGRIRPEQLNKVSMEQAVRRTYEYDQELAAKMNAARAAQREGLPVYKEYPEGYRWVELNKPGSFASESEAMGHSVRGYEPPKGHPDWVEGSGEMGHSGYGHGGWEAIKSGNAKVYSLVNPKGEPHVTIETKAHNPSLEFGYAQENHPELLEKYRADKNKYSNSWPEFLSKEAPELLENRKDKITQIKGKQNAAPKEEYLPFVQDFVKGGKWSDVGDLGNTGLRNAESWVNPDTMAEYRKHGLEAPKYATEAELDALHAQYEKLAKPEGMKRGGVVISNNPDTMMMAVNDVKMQAGGLSKLIKGAQKAAKIEVPIKFPVSRGPSVDEIRAMAERMAPQVMGEFVRAAPTPSNPKPSTNVVGKTQKQFEREKTLPIEYENIKPEVTPEEFDYAKKKGALLIGAQGDVTPGNRMLMSIDEQPLSVPVHLQAGPEWALYNPSAWAASDQMAKTYMKRAGQAAEAYGADPLLHYHKMTPDANFYAMHHLNSVLGHLRPEELMLRDPKLYQQMVEEIRTRDVGFGKHPEFEGFEDPLNLQIHAQIDPNFRRHLSAIFNGPKFTERYGLNSGQDVMAATSLPELRDLEAGASGYAVVPLDVKAPLKNFEAESQTYDTGFPKAGALERSKYPSPYQLIYRDTLNWMKENPSANKSSEFGRMNMIVPKQQIDDQLIDAIGEYQRRMKELTGKKKGGAIKKAAGGAITGDDLIIEERPL